MKFIIGIGALLAGLALVWVLVLPSNKHDLNIDLAELHETQPDNCDQVVKPSWLGVGSGAISVAIEQAQEGARICISAGTYEDAIVVKNPIQIIGFGETLPIIVSTSSDDVIQWHAKSGLLENLVLRQVGGDPSGSQVTGQNGNALFREGQPAYFKDEAHAGFTIVNSALTLNNVGIQNDIFSGVFITGPDADVTMSNALLFDNAEAGILMIEAANVTLENTQIRNSANEGIRLDTGAQLTATGVSLSGSGHSAIFSQNSAGFEISDSVFNRGRAGGIVMGHQSGPASISDTKITGYNNGLGGIAMRGGTELHLDGVTVSKNSNGVLCLPVLSGPDSPPQRIEIQRSTISDNNRWGMTTSRACNVQMIDSVVAGNADGGIENNGVLEVSGATLTRNGGNGQAAGLVTHQVSALTMSDTTVSRNRPHGLTLKSGAIVQIDTTQITENQDTGVLFPVLPQSESDRHGQDIDVLLARHSITNAAAGMVFRDVIIGPHPNATWRIDQGYLGEGDYVEAEVSGLD